MRPPMMGTWQVRIVAARPFSIHGDNYFELLIARLDLPPGEHPEAILRAPAHVFTTPPEAEQTVEIQFLMGQVTSVKST
jgi:hypothetical protein